MKNILVLGVTIALLYLGYDALQPPPAPARVPVVEQTAPPVAPKLYFHSALDAPAMPTNVSTGTSYFSMDPSSRFAGSYVNGATGSHLYGAPGYVVVEGNTSAVPARTGTASVSHLADTIQAQQSQWKSYLREETPRATPNPNGTAR